MNHISLFSGQGGFDLAAQYMGWNNIANCEIDPFCQRILKYYWPNATTHTDIRTTDFSIYRGRCDILTGGFPCQPYSTAGKRLGKEDARHLWPEMLRAIREVSPRWVVGENVRGLINWNGGLVFDEVQADLESAGYEVTPFILPAAGVNAPHRRDRVWFIAFNAECSANGSDKTGSGSGYGMGMEERSVLPARWQQGADNAESSDTHAADPAGLRCEWDISSGETLQRPEQACGEAGASDPEVATDSPIVTQREQANEINAITESGETWPVSGSRYESGSWSNFPTQPPLRTGDDGLPAMLHRKTIQNENSMDRDIIIKSCIDRGFLFCNYETGIIYSTRSRNRIEQGMAIELKGSNCNGYRVHTIYFEGSKKQCRAHQIVWIAAHGLYDKDKFMIDHIDRDKMNNRLSNLRLVDAKENRENSTPYSGKLSPEEKNRLFALYSEGDMSMRELADDFGISKSRVQQLIKEHSGLDGITLDDWCEKSIAAAGNAVVPQVVFQIFQAIQKYESS